MLRWTVLLRHPSPQRDMAERGHSLESIKASIEARKPDFDAYIDPQKKYADVIIQVRPVSASPTPRHRTRQWRICTDVLCPHYPLPRIGDQGEG